MKKHILLIDEDKAGLQLFKQAFDEMELNCKCTYSESFRHAEQMLTYLVPDNIFVKLDSNVSEGLVFVRTIKKDRRFKRVPVVVYSANMPYYNFLARGHGADYCMMKPNNSQEVRRAMDAVLLLDSGYPA